MGTGGDTAADVVAQGGVWRRHARQWSRIGAPLRPSPGDGRLMLQFAAPALAAGGECVVVVLGVTPELVQLPWPGDARLLAFDHSADMIASAWQPHPRLRSSVRQADWRDMPLPVHAADVVAGDGSLTVLPDAKGIGEVLAEVARILRPGGRLLLRCFLAPAQREPPEQVADATWHGDVEGFHALKWRLAMALPRDAGLGIGVVDIHDAFERLFPDRDALAARTGWARATIDTIDAYRGQATRYAFPTRSELEACAAPWFRVVAEGTCDYELAERCPTLAFERPPG